MNILMKGYVYLVYLNLIAIPMKKTFLVLVLTLSVPLWSQAQSGSSSVKEEDRNFRIPLLGETAPSFTATSTNGNLNFPSDLGTSWKVLFSHPQDFTPVCSTEIYELASLQSEFEKLGVKIVVMSTDPLDTHVQWKKALEDLNLNNKGKVKINFPLVDDEDLAVSKKYGMIQAASNTTKAVRGVFIIDPKNVIQAIYFYPMNIGRSTDELLRMVSALQTSAENNVLTPVNWKSGSDLLVRVPPVVDAKNTPVPEGFYSPVWFLWYKKSN